MSSSLEEYNAFGPWVFIIKEEKDIPALYKDYVSIDIDDFIIKIPRNIERRKATPDMHLYDKVLQIKADKLLMFSRLEDSVIPEEINYSDVLSVENIHNLLDGTLLIYKSQSTIDIKYNTASNQIMMDVCDIIRKKISTGEANKKYTLPELKNIKLSYFLQNLFNRILLRERVRIIDVQESIALEKKKNNLFTNIKSILKKSYCKNILFLGNKRELILISIQENIKDEKSKDYSYNHLYIPLKNIKSIKIDNETFYKNIKELNIYVGEHIFSFNISDSMAERINNELNWT